MIATSGGFTARSALPGRSSLPAVGIPLHQIVYVCANVYVCACVRPFCYYYYYVQGTYTQKSKTVRIVCRTIWLKKRSSIINYLHIIITITSIISPASLSEHLHRSIISYSIAVSSC